MSFLFAQLGKIAWIIELHFHTYPDMIIQKMRWFISTRVWFRNKNQI